MSSDPVCYTNGMTEETFTDNDIRAKLIAGGSLDFAWNVGRALSDWLPGEGMVAIMRAENASETLVAALIEGLRLQGRTVCDAVRGQIDQLREVIADQQYAGGVLVGYDETTQQVTIELLEEQGKLIDSQSGLSDIEMMIESGNLVPSVTKGELVVLNA